jgi:acyl-CoA synthetase (AMP-forming)/AMP-acid ligase II
LIDSILPLHVSIARWAAAQPDKTAAISGDQQLTYGQLEARIAAAAEGLRRAGATPGMRVGATTESSIEHLVGVVAAMAADVIPVPLPPDEAAAVSEIVADAGLEIVIGCGPVRPHIAAALGSRLRKLTDLEADGRGATATAQRATPQPGDEAMIYYTSGTSSGVRKGVVQCHRALEATARYITDAMGITGETIEFVASTTDNAFWYGRCRVVLRAGGCVVLNDGAFNPLSILGKVERHRCNAISGDTPVYLILLKHFPERFARLGSSLRWIKVASQAMAPEWRQKLLDAAPTARVIMNYGLTEAMRCCLMSMRENMHRPESVGQPSPGVELRVVDTDRSPVPAGETGAIEVRGDNLALGYLNNPAMWRQRCPDGWYITGDIGMADSEGYVTVKGRADEAINVGGKTIAPIEVERYLAPFITESVFAICAAPDPRGVLGEVPALCVEGEWREKDSWDNLRHAVLKRVPGPYVPRVLMTFGAIPRTAAGKIQRNRLRQMLEAASKTDA